MGLSTESIGAIRRLLSNHPRGQIKQFLLEAGAKKERILSIPIVNDMKSTDYRSQAEVLSLMFDTIYTDYKSNEADRIVLNLIRIIIKNRVDFPDSILEVISDVRKKLMSDGIDLKEVLSPENLVCTANIESTMNTSYKYDVFICHASEDKESFVRSLASKLHNKGLQVWYDEFSLTIGDSLRRSIDHGLAHSRFGIVVLSHSFFAKEWPQRELDGLTSREMEGVKVILPIWHNVSREQIMRYSPTLADRVGIQTSKGLDYIVDELLRVIQK